MSETLRVFVASSSEQLEIVREIVKTINKSKEFHAQPWEEEVFEFSKAYIESLEQELDRADFAIVVLTGEDAGNVRGKSVNLPRDNVIFELGLFSGRLGRERCFFFVDGNTDTKVASDLSGVKPVNFFRGAEASGAARPDLATQIKKVTKRMSKLRGRCKPTSAVRRKQERLWRFSSGLAGHWWERMRKGEDDKSALSYLTVTVDEVTNTPRIDGKAYGLAGESLAKWWTVTTGVLLESNQKSKVFYRWEGEHEDAHGQKYGGHGVMVLDDDRLISGDGYYYDTNFAQLHDGAVTRVKHFGLYRCSEDDVRTMAKSWTEEAENLVKERLKLKGR